NRAGGLLRAGAPRNRPRPALVVADGEKRDVAKQIVRSANHAIESGLGETEVGEKGLRICRTKLGDLELDFRADYDGGAAHRREPGPEPGGFDGTIRAGNRGLADVQHDEQRLGREKLKSAKASHIVAGETERAQSLAGFERRLATQEQI